ncbi:putative alpha beta-hydrolase [Lyophyllum shimeji]|uniref:Alpha beta-hydrolase n=1 Tax=Lyophyllum shimeji TaxID=47721 RepID=A0A9P3UPK1_LYOSH|nr:putative alpha beta-hydrolase [Lyophyllum shimeji]
MPHVPIDTPTGAIELHYEIATPTSHSSPTIDAQLPCILFLHAGYAAQEIFELQFCDPRLRTQFNLIGVDMRAYGSTKGSIGQEEYGPADSADDIYRFIKALDLPPVHIFGLAIGCCVGLELAATHPDLVLSLTLCSPLPAAEPEDIAAGRLEVYHLWVEAFNHDGSDSQPVDGDSAVLQDLLHGAQQLAFNNESNQVIDAMSRNALDQAIRNRAGTPAKLKESYQASVGWFLNRRPQSREALAKIKCSICLIHCEDDIAYPLRYTQELEEQLRDAGIRHVGLCEIPGPHYGNVVNPQAINPILLEHALSASSAKQTGSAPRYMPDFNDPERQQQNGQQDCQKMVTPFTETLAQYGYDPQATDDDCDC